MPQTYGFEIECYGLTPAQIKNAIESVSGLVYQSPEQSWNTGSNDTNRRIYGYMESKRVPLRTVEAGTGNLWIAATDGSLHNADKYNGLAHEIISPVMVGMDGLKTVKKVMKALSTAGAKVDKTCGLHVTMGVENVSARFRRMGTQKKAACLLNLIEAYNYFQDGAFSELCSPSRNPRASVASTYARDVRIPMESNYGTATKYTVKDFCDFNDGLRRGRIHNLFDGVGRGAVNMAHFWDAGVVEFRQHQGTLDGDKIMNWALLCHKLLSWAVNPEHINNLVDVRNFPPTVSGLCAMVNAGSMLTTALLERQSVLRDSRYYEATGNRSEAIYEEFQIENTTASRDDILLALSYIGVVA